MDPVIALRQIAYYKDRAREDPRRVMAYRNAADVVEALTDAEREQHGAGQQLAVASRHRAQDREGHRPGVGRRRARCTGRIAFRRQKISVAARSVRRCAATCTCTRTGPTARRPSRR